MNQMANFAMNLIQQNPKIANNPMTQQLINVIRNGDRAQGEKIAENLCKTYGVTKEQAIQQASQMFFGR